MRKVWEYKEAGHAMIQLRKAGVMSFLHIVSSAKSVSSFEFEVINAKSNLLKWITGINIRRMINLR